MRWVLFGLLFSLSAFVSAQDYNHVFVFLHNKSNEPNISKERQEELQIAHGKNINRLLVEKKMIVAGPFDGGGGIFIFNSGKVTEVNKWLDTDPAVKANRWDIEMFPVYFLKGEVCLMKKPYEMTSYNFVRVRLVNDIANYKMNQGDLDIWKQLKNNKQTILVGVFPQSDGGVIVYTGEKQDLWFGDNQEDRISLEHKRVWVAKGSFCK